MKFSPITIYLSIFIVAVILIIYLAQGSNQAVTDTNNPHSRLPDDDIHRNLGDVQADMPSKDNVSEKFKQKIAELRSKLESSPTDTASMKELADLQYMAHNTVEAMELYKKILTYDSKRTDVNFAIGVIHYNNKEYGTAEKIVKQVLSYDPDNTVAMYNLGAISNAKGDLSSALKYWKTLVEKHPDTHEAFLAETAIKKLEERK